MKKEKIKYIIQGIIIGIILMSTTVYAAVCIHQASDVGYSSSNDLTSTNVQDALNELYALCNNQGFNVDFYDENGNVAEQKIYHFVHGMTFTEFVASSYNTSLPGSEKFSTPITTGKVQCGTGLYYPLQYNNGQDVSASDIISPTTIYKLLPDTCCFDPETLIQTDLEGHTKKIKDFEVGDTVVVQSSITGERYVTTVLKEAHEHPNTYDFGEVILENGTILRFNTYHPIYTIDGFKTLTKFKDLPKLTDKDIVLLEDGNQIPIKEIKRYNVEKAEMTYNLLIKGINEYFLEDEYGYFANGVLVHHGIEKYDDEAHYRLKHQDRCINKNLYKDYDFDAASDEEIILFLAKLNFENEDAYKEYIKYYITPEQYIRYATFAKKVKAKTEELKKEDMKLNQNGINHYKNFKSKNNH